MRTDHRFSGYLPENRYLVASVIGVGAVGSFVALGLSKLGPGRLQLIDPDVVEPQNTTVQLPGVPFLHMPKVEALNHLLLSVRDPGLQLPYTQSCWNRGGDRNFQIVTSPFQPTLEQGYAALFVLGVDSIKARREIMTQLTSRVRTLREDSTICTGILDFRASIRVLESHFVSTPREAEDYLARLPEDDAVPDEPCNAQMSPAIGMLAGGIATAVAQQLLRRNREAIPRHQAIDIENFMSMGWDGAAIESAA